MGKQSRQNRVPPEIRRSRDASGEVEVFEDGTKRTSFHGEAAAKLLAG